VKVDYYGSPTDLKSIALISVPEATQLLVKPFSPGDLKAIEKAIGDSNLGLTPHSDGKQLRVNLPALSQERRIQLSNQAKQFAEAAKVKVRNSRRDANKLIDTEQKDGDMTEDEAEKGKEQVQDLIKTYEAKLDELVEHKRKDIMQV
jgi:ribosome recycling factor